MVGTKGGYRPYTFLVAASVLFGLLGCSAGAPDLHRFGGGAEGEGRRPGADAELDVGGGRERVAGEGSAGIAALISELEQEVPRLLERYDVPGAAIALVRDGEPVWSDGFGYIDLDGREPVSSDTIFEAGSIAKSITAWTVLQLVDEGKLALDDRVITHLPNEVADRFRAANRGGVPAETLTVGELISNSGGMPFALAAGDLEDLRAGRMDSKHLRRRAPSGRQFEYSNPAFIVAALMVESVSGKPFAELAEREVFEPLGMQSSGFGAQARFAESAATGHTFDGTPVRWDDHGPLGAGGLYSTAADLARFLAAYHAHEAAHGAADTATADAQTVLSADSYRAMLEPVIEVEGAYHSLMAEYYALGHFVDILQDYPADEARAALPAKAVSHGGESSGWLTAYYTIPQSGDGFVLLTNSRRSWSLVRLARIWLDALEIPHPTMVGSYYRLGAALVGLAGVAIIASLSILFVAFRRRKRPRTPGGPGARVGAWTLSVLGIALLLGWWAVVHGVVSMFFPVLVGLPAAAVTLCALTLIVVAAPAAVYRPDG